jgi:MoaA/NifB/PqqE/SkfB family radical SAM enzyme
MPARGITIDVEPTNRCNASCHFCPRDKTPHQGLMKPEVFDQTLARIIELRDMAGTALDSSFKVSFCGLGEPLLNPKAPVFVQNVRDAGFECVMSSNGAILDEKRGRALLDAGLQQININVGDEGEAYEDVYKLPFEKTRDNVIQFAEMAGDQCQVNIVLVDYRCDRDHIKHMVKYWRSHGLSDFVFFDVMNRGGALFVDEMEYESFSERAEARAILESKDEVAICGIPFISLFVGYDGQYYLCCSDWVKETAMGSVFDASFLSVTGQKLHHVVSREPVCKSCNWDPVNQLTDTLRAIKSGDATEAQRDEQIESMLNTSRLVMNVIRDAEPIIGKVSADPGRPAKKLIPVSAQ